MTQLIEQAKQHQLAGRFAQAEEIYRQILAAEPRQSYVVFLLGVLCYQTGRAAEAIEMLQRAAAINPTVADCRHQLGLALVAAGRRQEAIAAFQKSIELRGDFGPSHNALGNELLAVGDVHGGIAAHRRAVELAPDVAGFWSNLGIALYLNQQQDEAIAAFKKAVALKPDFAEAFNNLGSALWLAGESAAAAEAYEKALAAQPTFAVAHENLGNVLRDLGRFGEAIAACRQAIALDPNSAGAYKSLGTSQRAMGDLDGAIASYQRAIELNPVGLDFHVNLALSHLYRAESEPSLQLEILRAWDERWVQPLVRQIQPFGNDRQANRRLRVGYVSPDFRNHSVAVFLLGIFANHNPESVEIFCYSGVQKPDAMTERLKKMVHHWRDINGTKDPEAAEMIRQDKIDLLVDLSGHTTGNRMMLFARRPAPVQVSYLGYAATTGLCTIDYRLTDAYADPPGMTERLHSETLVRLPRTFLCYTVPRDMPEVEPPPVLEKGFVTFASFNYLPKISSLSIGMWSEILKRVPGSRMVVKSLGLSDSAAKDLLLEKFAHCGISADRLRIHGLMDVEAHFAMYRDIDIVLDTYPYCGTTTTCEAIWMGVPVITLAGKAHISRVGVSLLSNIGLTDLIAQTSEGYIEIAEKLAGDTHRMSELRARQRQMMAQSPLMDGKTFTRNLEAVYRELWQRWLATNFGRG
jgi:protein O-GlcNAc transferase